LPATTALRKIFFGPTGVAENAKCRASGWRCCCRVCTRCGKRVYAYAIICGVGPAEYYSKTVGATLIEGSSPGIYDFGVLRKSQGVDG